MNIYEKLKERELFQNSSNKINFQTIYTGFDGTADSLQIGNLIPIAALRILNKLNIKIIVVLGGGTSKIGDPSGKSETRKQLETDSINKNLNQIKNQIKKLLPNAIIVNNADWLNSLSFMNFLDQAATFIPVSKIIKLKTFAERLKNNQPFTMKELLYPLLQGYDFLHLFEQNNCTAQLGGQDQWCNLLTGIDLIQSKHGNNIKVTAITCPLLTDSNGKKMGKSLNGAIYLSKEKCSIFDFWNFWRNIDDSIVKTCLLKFTELPLLHIENLVKNDINKAKIELANEITTWIHSKEDAKIAEKQAENLFINKNFDTLQPIIVSTNKLIEIVAKLKNISNSESKELIRNGSVKENDITITNVSHNVQNQAIIKIGKKHIFKINIK